ncbi:divalent-cation tolerance protein CutA [Mangrovibrevibacter kandeliae]|uniref:divalent-cation tolerance protein CutA n=1 Tax=Mangrovibrevibacter kandeliae TaxID=2968473 RepID=UPI002117E9CD|nr:divalent-cation tolerance protein CutA [Aurantimonas sp. CSK15Z-1]MCQ8782227.1 divalent-cation tolerance protein CutA [Aurantimonas sp. CSK15Z-1]
MIEALEITVSCPDDGVARAIADALLAGHLAACCTVSGPVESRYVWHGAVETASEVVLAIKTRAALFDAAAELIRTHHPYDTPAIFGHAVALTDAATSAWLDETTRTEELA